jgi:hypothetical protein
MTGGSAGMTLAGGKSKFLEKNIQQCDSCITYPTWTGLESNPGALVEGRVTNRPELDTLLLLLLLWMSLVTGISSRYFS